MRRLKDTQALCLARLRALLSRAIRQRYVSLFHCAPPFRLTRIHDFTFLPHILSCPKATGDILLKDITDWAMPQVTPEQMAECLDQLIDDEYYHSTTVTIDLEEQSLSDEQPREDKLSDIVLKIAEHLYNFRTGNQKTQPTFLKYINTWNVGGGRCLEPVEMRKTKQCVLAYARDQYNVARDPLAHWTSEQPTQLLSQLTGIQIASSAATIKNTHPSGGVAILLPIGYQLLQQEEVLPGRILAATVQLRKTNFRLITVYLHPEKNQGRTPSAHRLHSQDRPTRVDLHCR